MPTEISVQQKGGVFDFPFKDGSFYSVSLSQGSFLLEVWGASGGNQSGGKSRQFVGIGGKGGYSRGILTVSKPNTLLFVYVGGSGPSYSTASPTQSPGGFNGGGSSLGRSSCCGGGSGGGGSTDICTIKSDLVLISGITTRTESSYKSRIIVGGGGGGGFGGLDNWSSRMTSYGGNGGGITSGGSGYNQSYGCGINKCDNLDHGNEHQFSYNFVTGSSQTSTGSKGNNKGSNAPLDGARPGYFGYGGSATKTSANSGGGGGGGWFGGYSGSSGSNDLGTGGAGGSGYVHTSINELSTLDQSYYLQDAKLFDGNSSFPNPFDRFNNETGHNGNGYARITIISLQPKKCQYSCYHSTLFFFNHLFFVLLLIPK